MYLALLEYGNENLPRFLEKAEQNSFNVICVPLNYVEMPKEFHRAPMKDNYSKMLYPDLIFTSHEWNSKVITMLSEDIDCESTNERVRCNSEMTVQRDIAWSEHVHSAGLMMIRLKSGNNDNLTRVIMHNIKGTGNFLVQVPVYNAELNHCVWRSDIDEDTLRKIEQEDTWQWWNKFRCLADFSPKIKVVLEFNESNFPDQDVIRRWLGEPIEAIIIPSTLFVKNRSNCPVLPKQWQEVFARFIKCNASIIVSTSTGDNSLKLYADYLINFRELHKNRNELKDLEDVLEIPLQPLYDNLDCYTYEIFEMDPVKYELYQKAIEAALTDKVSEDEIEKRTLIVMVLGAGRGPLVRSVLNASDKIKRKVRVYIIEKNPNAIRTLSNIVKKLWTNRDVRIFSEDMRNFNPPEKADILVSELLGSLGDNELSPECLDCAQRLLKPDGISIPCKSTSFVNPVMSMKILNAVRNIPSDTFNRGKWNHYLYNAEQVYVILLKTAFNISLSQPLFEFEHPNPVQPINNSRYKKLKFIATMDSVLNGIVGYFEAVLYKDIIISTHSPTHTLGMSSWFPLYFPFAEPVEVKKDETIEVNFWRCTTPQKVWYEWALTSPKKSHIHNRSGRSSFILT